VFKLICSPDEYLLESRIAEWQAQLEQQYGELETVVVSRDDITAEQLFETLDFSPLFASARLVILNRLPLWDESGRRSALLNQIKDGLLAYIQDPPEGQAVIATAIKVAAQNPLVSELKKLGAFEEIKTPTPGERKTILQQAAARRGLVISENELKLLSESKPGLFYLITLFDKWTLIPGIKISRELLEQEGVVAASEGPIFAFTDALILGQASRALAELKHLQEAGEPGLKILATINRQLMTLSKVKGWGEEGRSASEIAADIGDKKGFRSKRLLQDAERIDWRRLSMLFCLICATDIAIKTSRFSETMALEYLAFNAAHRSPA